MPFSYEVQGTSTFLAYRLDVGETLDQDAFGMLRNNTVPHVISPTYSQLDDTRVLRYDISGLKVARDCFAQRVFTRQQLIALLLGTADGFAALGEYLIDERMVACSLDCLYIDDHLGIRMVCVPVTGFSGGGARGFLNELLGKLRQDGSSDTRYLGEVRALLSDASGFSVGKFQKLLGSLTLKPARPQSGISAPLSGSSGLGSAGLGSAGLGVSGSSSLASSVSSGSLNRSGMTGGSDAFLTRSGGMSPSSREGSDSLASASASGSFGGMAIPPAVGSSGGGTGDPGRLWPSVSGCLADEKEQKKGLFGHKKKEKKEKENPAKQKEPKQKRTKFKFGKRRASDADDAGAAMASGRPSMSNAPFAMPVPGGTPSADHSVQVGDRVRHADGQGHPASVPASQTFDCGWQSPVNLSHAGSGNEEGFGVTEVFGVASPVERREMGVDPARVQAQSAPASKVLGRPGQRAVDGAAYLKRIGTGEIKLVDVTPFRIGRRRSEVDYYLADKPRVSRVHAIIEHENGGFVISDNASANHTTVNGIELKSFEKVSLTHGDRIGLGDEEFLFLLG